jgi:hypothetical protein
VLLGVGHHAVDEDIARTGGDEFGKAVQKVVLPQPVGPTIARNSPLATLKEMLFRTSRSPKRL